MKYVQPTKLKVLLILFFGTAAWGIYMGLTTPSEISLYVTTLGVINLCLGGFVGWIFFTQQPRSKDKRKK